MRWIFGCNFAPIRAWSPCHRVPQCGRCGLLRVRNSAGPAPSRRLEVPTDQLLDVQEAEKRHAHGDDGLARLAHDAPGRALHESGRPEAARDEHEGETDVNTDWQTSRFGLPLARKALEINGRRSGW